MPSRFGYEPGPGFDGSAGYGTDLAAREVNMNVDQNQEGDCPWSADGEHHYVNGKCRFCDAKQ